MSEVKSDNQLVPVQNALTEFEKVSAGLMDLTAKYANVVYDVATTKGMDEAKAARLAIREPRYAVQRATKAAKDELNSIKKNVEERGAQIIEALTRIEDPIDAQVKAEEERKAAEKARKEQAERERVEAIQMAIGSIRAIPLNVVEASATYIKQALDQVAALEITEQHYAEFLPHAADAKDAAVSQLIAMHQRAVATEQAQAELKAQQEELARMRARVEAEMAAQRAEIELQKAELEAARTAAEAARMAEQQRINAAAARAAAAEAERVAEEERLAKAQQEDAFEAELVVAKQEAEAVAKVESTVIKAVNLEALAELAEAKAAEIVALPIIDIGFDGVEVPTAAPARAPHIDQPLPIDMIELPVIGGKPADMDIVVAVADAFDVSIEVALDYITSINVQAVVEAIAEAA